MKLTTYNELTNFITAFDSGNLNLLIIKSEGGLAKSTLAGELVHDKLYFSGHATPLAIFQKVQQNPDSKLLFDDVDALIQNKGNVSLLKQLADTRKEKTVQYNSTTKIMEGRPQEFVSNNKVMLLVNDIKRVGKNMKALMTRGFYINFVPTREEVMMKLKEFAKDKEIVGFLDSNKNNLQELNLRTYVRAKELKEVKLDWKDWIIKEFARSKAEILFEEIKELKATERNEIWERETGMTVRTLRNWVKKENRKD